MTHPFSTDAFSSVREFLYSASWSRTRLRDEQRTRAAERMLAGRSCDHALFADLLDWAALRQTCREMRQSMPVEPLRANLQSLSNRFVARCFEDLERRTENPLEQTRAAFYSHAPRLSNWEGRRWLLMMVVIEDRDPDQHLLEEDYDEPGYLDRLGAPIPEPVTPHARELVGDEMMDV